MLELGSQTIAILALSLAVAIFAGAFLFRKDTESENHKKHAIAIAGKLRSYGFQLIPEMLENFAVGDYSGIVEELKQTAKLFAKGDQYVIAEIQAVVERIAATENGRKLLTEALAKVASAAAKKSESAGVLVSVPAI